PGRVRSGSSTESVGLSISRLLFPTKADDPCHIPGPAEHRLGLVEALSAGPPPLGARTSCQAAGSSPGASPRLTPKGVSGFCPDWLKYFQDQGGLPYSRPIFRSCPCCWGPGAARVRRLRRRPRTPGKNLASTCSVICGQGRRHFSNRLRN